MGQSDKLLTICMLILDTFCVITISSSITNSVIRRKRFDQLINNSYITRTKDQIIFEEYNRLCREILESVPLCPVKIEGHAQVDR